MTAIAHMCTIGHNVCDVRCVEMLNSLKYMSTLYCLTSWLMTFTSSMSSLLGMGSTSGVRRALQLPIRKLYLHEMPVFIDITYQIHFALNGMTVQTHKIMCLYLAYSPSTFQCLHIFPPCRHICSSTLVRTRLRQGPPSILITEQNVDAKHSFQKKLSSKTT